MGSLFKVFFVVVFLIPPLLVGSAFCQETYPSKPITMMYGFTAGMGGTIARLIARGAEKE